MVRHKETIQDKDAKGDRFRVTSGGRETFDMDIDIPVDPAHGGRLWASSPDW